MARLAQVNRLHMEYFAYYLQRMQATGDGEGSLLDSTLVLRGCAFGDSNSHDKLDLPIILAGGGLAGNRHVVVPKLTPMSNLMLAMLHHFGIPMDSFGDSTGPLTGLLG
jgi:hypothetical protein